LDNFFQVTIENVGDVFLRQGVQSTTITTYEGHPKSFRPRHIRQQYFLQSIHQWSIHPLRTLVSWLRIWRRC